MSWVSLRKSYVAFQNIIFFTVQKGFIHCETSVDALNNVIPPETNNQYDDFSN